MSELLLELRQFNTASVLLRLFLALVFGGAVGLERARKHRAAGFRTYMLVCLGATLTMLLGQYESLMLKTLWKDAAAQLNLNIDVARFGAQVINGIGFIGAGTIMVTNRKEAKGLTTAAGLWASACMGLAIGAGFYECVTLGLLLILLCVCVLPPLENAMLRLSRSMNLYVEFDSLDAVGPLFSAIKAQDVIIYDVDLDRGKSEQARNPSAVFTMRLRRRKPHSKVLAEIARLESVRTIYEL